MTNKVEKWTRNKDVCLSPQGSGMASSRAVTARWEANDNRWRPAFSATLAGRTEYAFSLFFDSISPTHLNHTGALLVFTNNMKRLNCLALQKFSGNAEGKIQVLEPIFIFSLLSLKWNRCACGIATSRTLFYVNGRKEKSEYIRYE